MPFTPYYGSYEVASTVTPTSKMRGLKLRETGNMLEVMQLVSGTAAGQTSGKNLDSAFPVSNRKLVYKKCFPGHTLGEEF